MFTSRCVCLEPRTCECASTKNWRSGTRVKYWRADVDRSGVAQLASSEGGETRTKNKGGRLGLAVVLFQEW